MEQMWKNSLYLKKNDAVFKGTDYCLQQVSFNRIQDQQSQKGNSFKKWVRV